ncbi:amidohydrolase family protein [Paracoccus sp. SSJ]|uniref:amidohydrolase family protein n=1 Tax=Paracoccus sp. SSJ TaxID=3050636 RepID=UPI00254F44CB|nr:amidohydrolase family protein [Paracoccus sp. SSJ]MDK8871029.1 amidohydrolase family protein [Paracoccus sp. SSJ]
MLIIEADHLIAHAAAPLQSGAAVVVIDGLVHAIGPRAELRAHYPLARRLDLGGSLLLPGLINAHQHGRGLSQIQLGYPDDQLEPWIARRRGRGAPDTYALTRLAALRMLANGVTATLHANYSYASGDYEAELRAAIRAYADTGLRATIAVGYADRGALIYPPDDEAAFVSMLSAKARGLIRAGRPAYLPLTETLDLMARLCAEYAGHPTLSFAYGPAGPQWVSDEAWRVLAGDAARRGLGLHFHLLESPAQAACARQLYPSGVLAHLERLGVFQAAASAAHFVHATERDIADAARLGIAIVTNPGSNMRLGNGPPPLDALHRAGVCIAIGSDNCTLQDDEDLLAELRLADALTRRGRTDDVMGGMWMLDAATGAGTQAAFLNGTGAIAPGMKADLIALDLDPTQGAFLDPDMGLLDVTMARAKGRDVTLTMVAGRILYHKAKFPGADLAQARRAACRTAYAARSAGPDTQAAAEEIAEALRRHYTQPVRT